MSAVIIPILPDEETELSRRVNNMLQGIELVKLRRLNWNPDPSDSDSTFLSCDQFISKKC